MFSLIPLIIVFPVLGLLVNIVIGKRLGDRGAGIFASLAAGAAFVIAVLQAVALAQNGFQAVTVPVADWIVIGALQIPWAFQVDTLSVAMMLVVTGVGTLIHVYAIEYMYADVHHHGDAGRYPRFFVYLNLFLAAMLVLVSANNYAMMFVGWEGVGLCSFLLIGFWFEKGEGSVGNARAARKAFVVNRIGDFGMLLAIFLMFTTFGSLTFDTVFAQANTVGASPGVFVAITLLLLLGATGKSAQIPLYVWLPDAMAGPTPVSALIHAATMVTAGIYMIARSHVLFALAPFSQGVVALVGAITALWAATIAVGQFDIKKVLAYSTISQLGFMVTAVGLGANVAGMFHLIGHAFFKALLFLAAGSVIYALEHERTHDHTFDPQDMRNMGALWDRLPITRWVYLIGALALAGIPPFVGFFSKDEILLAAFNSSNKTVYILLTIAAFLTAFYMGRQVFLIFFGQARSRAAKDAVDSPKTMTLTLVVLGALSLLGGVLNLPGNFSGAHLLTSWLAPTLGEAEPSEFSFLVASVSTGLALLAFVLAYLLYHDKPSTAKKPDPLQDYIGEISVWLRDKWYVDEIYDALIIQPYNSLSGFLALTIDGRFWHDWFHNTLLGGLTQSVSRLFRRLQTGDVRNYALAMFIGVLAILSYFLLGS
jgi:NADH-quinone oxidoreductase subunit L